LGLALEANDGPSARKAGFDDLTAKSPLQLGLITKAC